ncbi:hypothetical protein scyTo_0009180 [Scyliorhinus torazame]|uniref:Uncharacterized protein n=1 Tax=Scyliorhinus torazame TaxID=75743 RepID=A0A401NHW4_SCYTO|nr:hypothetical protein [Scyliorhinus torazame]
MEIKVYKVLKIEEAVKKKKVYQVHRGNKREKQGFPFESVSQCPTQSRVTKSMDRVDGANLHLFPCFLQKTIQIQIVKNLGTEYNKRQRSWKQTHGYSSLLQKT